MEDVARHEHLAFHSDLELEALCEAIRAVLGLPPFDFGSENETEWGLVVHDGVEYNVSKPYEDGTLQEWDDTVPGWCNVGMTLLVSKQHPRATDPDWSVVVLVRNVGERLAAGLGGPIAFHRTSTSPPIRGEGFRPHLFLTPDNK